MRGPRGEETGALVELGGRACWGEAARHKPGGWKERGRASLQDGEDEGGEGRAGRAAPTQLNLLRDSPRPCVRKRKRK